MGWFTDGPGEVQYRYGDVVAAARESGVGALWACPRIEGVGTAFFREAQRDALARGLPWVTLPLDADPTSPGDWIPIPRDTNAWRLLAFLAQTIAENAPTLTELLGEGWDEEEVYASLDFEWSVGEEDYPALLAWLNAALPSPALTLEALKRGRITRPPWYEPPPDLEAAFQRLSAADGPRHLVARMLGAASVSGEALLLRQPGDDYQGEVSLGEE